MTTQEEIEITWGHQRSSILHPVAAHGQKNTTSTTVWHATTSQTTHEIECYNCLYPHPRRTCPLLKCKACGEFGHGRVICPLQRISDGNATAVFKQREFFSLTVNNRYERASRLNWREGLQP
jgi:hypothetical protein